MVNKPEAEDDKESQEGYEEEAKKVKEPEAEMNETKMAYDKIHLQSRHR